MDDHDRNNLRGLVSWRGKILFLYYWGGVNGEDLVEWVDSKAFSSWHLGREKKSNGW